MKHILVEWKEIFGRHGLSISLEKMEMLWVGQQKKIDKRRVVREDVDVGESLTRKLVRSRLKWVRHVERMENGREWDG